MLASTRALHSEAQHTQHTAQLCCVPVCCAVLYFTVAQRVPRRDHKMSEPEPEPEPPTEAPARPAEAANEEEQDGEGVQLLRAQTVGELRHLAAAEGVDARRLEEARDSNDPKSEIVELVVEVRRRRMGQAAAGGPGRSGRVDDPMVELDVGGTRFSASLSTLTAVPGSHLATMLLGRGVEAGEDGVDHSSYEDSVATIDRDGPRCVVHVPEGGLLQAPAAAMSSADTCVSHRHPWAVSFRWVLSYLRWLAYGALPPLALPADSGNRLQVRPSLQHPCT